MLVVFVSVIMLCLALGLPALFTFKLVPWQNQRKLERKRLEYPQTVSGWETVMTFCPFDTDEVGELLDDMAAEWDYEFPHIDLRDIRKKIDGLMITFRKNDESLIKEDPRYTRHIKDKYGRNIAGDHDGDEVRVVYNAADTDAPTGERVGRTALAHEVAHELDELLGITDYDHRLEIYGSLGLVSRVKEKHS